MNRQTTLTVKRWTAIGIVLLLTGFFQLQASSIFMGEGEGSKISCLYSLFDEAPAPAILLTEEDCCDGSKPKAVTLLYNGEGCAESNTVQPLGTKWQCNQSGTGPNGDPAVYIVASKNSDGTGGTYFAGNVNLGGTFTADAANAGLTKLPSNTWFTVYASQGGAVLQRIRIHTSCSAPLVIGDQFGSLVLQNVVFEDGSSCSATPPPTCPDAVINVPAGQVCQGQAVVFSAPDLGFPCFTYTWNFGVGATPATATGLGPHSVTFASTGSKTVSLTVDNGCVPCPDGGGGSGSSGSSGSGSGGSGSGGSGSGGSGSGGSGSGSNNDDPCGGSGSGSSGSGSGGSGGSGSGGSGSGGSGSGSSSGSGTPVICPSAVSGGGSSGTGSGSNGSGSGSGGSGSGGSGSGGSGSGSSGGGSGSGACIVCRQTKTVSITVENCVPNPGKVGDFVWSDTNSNGIQETNEPGLPNVAVKLLTCSGTLVNSTLTNANGMYMFSNVPAGSYRVMVTNPNGATFMITLPNVGNDAADSDLGSDGMTACFDISPNENDPTVDAGFKPIPPPQCSVTPAVSNIQCQDNGTPATTDDTYTFTLTVTGSNTGSAWAATGAPNPISGTYGTPLNLGPYLISGGVLTLVVKDNANQSCSTTQSVIPPAPCSQQLAPATFGNFVWNDVNQNGAQNPNEPGIQGITVRLFKCDDTFVAEQTTGANGDYLFQNLAPNMLYYVVFSNLPSGAQFTIQDGTGDNIDSDANANGRTACTFLSPGEAELSVDAGIILQQPLPGTIGDFVWNDTDQDGMQDPGEPGVPGVTVRLFKCDGTFLAQTSTNNSGVYSFQNVAPNMSYYVEFSNLPTGFTFTTKDAVNDNLDSDADPANGRSDCFNIAAGQNDNTRDAGLKPSTVPPASVGDFVWNDLNQNGIQNPGEPGIPNVTVRLFTCNGTLVAQQSTGLDGGYFFTNVPPNASYYVEFSNLPAGFAFTGQDAGNDFNDSDANPANGRTGCFNLVPNQTDPTRDAGLIAAPQPNGKIGDFVWNDLDQDGVQDPNEPGIQGVSVTLFRCDGTFVGQFTTNANGLYQFINVPANTSYFLMFGNLPAGFQFTTQDVGGNDNIDSDANPATGKTACFNLATGQIDPTRDAGIFQPATTGPGKISDFVWFDTDGDGIQDPGEPGIPGIFVILETCTGQFVNFAITNAAGKYQFNNVQPGQYRVKFASPGALNGQPVQFTVQNAGNDDTVDSDPDWLGFTQCFTVNPGQNNTTVDAGFKGETPPPVCNISATASNVSCNGGQFTFTVIATGSNTGAWGFDIPALGLYMLQYGQPYNVGPFPAGSPVTLLLNDHDVNGCTTILTVNSPANCLGGGNNGNSSNLLAPTGNTSAEAAETEQHESEQTGNEVASRHQPGATSAAPEAALKVNLYPNPASTNVDLDIEGATGKTATVRILNHLGQLIRELKVDELDGTPVEMSLNDLQNGYYLIWIMAEGSKPVTHRLMVARY